MTTHPFTSPDQLRLHLTGQWSVAPAATGRVTFCDGTSVLGVEPLNNSVAAFATTMLPSGTRSLRAYYSGDANNAAASSQSLSHSVVASVSLGLKAAVTYQGDK